jgi:hypothetical protein
MIILTSEAGTGIATFFPWLQSTRRGHVLATEWLQYAHWLPTFIGANVLVFLLVVGGTVADGDDFGTTWRAAGYLAQAIYLLVRVRFLRKVVRIPFSSPVAARVAPWPVWVEYFTFGAMFVGCGWSNYIGAGDSVAWKAVTLLLSTFFAVYALLPGLNFLAYREMRAR